MNRSNRGWTLIEMTIFIALLGLFGLFAAQVFTQIRTLMITTHNDAQLTGRMEGIVYKLRHDVWNSGQITTQADGDGHYVITTTPGSVEWRWPADGSEIRRVETSGDRVVSDLTWPGIAGSRLEAAKAGMTLYMPRPRLDPQPLAIVSQQQWLKETQP